MHDPQRLNRHYAWWASPRNHAEFTRRKVDASRAVHAGAKQAAQRNKKKGSSPN